MAQGSETGGRGQGLSVLRAVLIAGCVVLGLALAVVVLLAVVYREPPAEEVIQAFREEGLEIGETRQVDREVDRSFVPKTYKEQMSFTVPSRESASGDGSLPSSPRRTWSRCASTTRGLGSCSPPTSTSRTKY